MSLHDKVDEERDPHIYVAVRRTSKKTLSHNLDTGEVWVMCAVLPGAATIQLHMGSSHHTPDKQMVRVVACGFLGSALIRPEQ